MPLVSLIVLELILFTTENKKLILWRKRDNVDQHQGCCALGRGMGQHQSLWYVIELVRTTRLVSWREGPLD
jgi:hypothetical protein